MNRLDFEKPLKEKAIRLLRMRAGTRYIDFEAGMLYQICLDLGMKNERLGKIGAQENNWSALVCSCATEKAAKQTLKRLIQSE